MSYRSAELLIEDLWEAIEKVERYTDDLNRFNLKISINSKSTS
jgi:hypothetical protein